jgi:PadR family transcriptional regulator PadR
MIEELQRHCYHISPGTLYPILHKMEARGWLKSTQQTHAGKVRRVYRATPNGRKVLKAAQARVHELFSELFEKV